MICQKEGLTFIKFGQIKWGDKGYIVLEWKKKISLGDINAAYFDY